MKQVTLATALLAACVFSTGAQADPPGPRATLVVLSTAPKVKPSFQDFMGYYEAIAHFEQQLALAVNGNAKAQGQVAEAYYEGHGVQQNFYKAVEWACRAVAQNDFIGEKIVIKASLASNSVYRDVVTCENVNAEPGVRPQLRPEALVAASN